MGGSSVGVQDVNRKSLVSAGEATVTPIRDGFRMFQSTPVAVLPQIGLVGTDVAPVATMAYPTAKASTSRIRFSTCLIVATFGTMTQGRRPGHWKRCRSEDVVARSWGMGEGP